MTIADLTLTPRDAVWFSAGAALFVAIETPAPWYVALIQFGLTALVAIGVITVCDRLHALLDRAFGVRLPAPFVGKRSGNMRDYWKAVADKDGAA